MKINWLCILLIGICSLNACHKPEQVNYIAHGGGMLNGLRTPNCVEAIEWSLNNEIKYIELDLQLTLDSQLVAMHDWKMFHAYTDTISDSLFIIMQNRAQFRNLRQLADSVPLTLEEVQTRKIAGIYTPITWMWIDSLMSHNDTVCIVTDKISSPEIIEKYFSQFRERVIVECFSLADYNALTDMGYQCFYSIVCFNKVNQWEIWSKKQVFKMRVRQFMQNNIFPKNYVFPKYNLPINDKSIKTKYRTRYGKMFAIYGVKDKAEADSLANMDSRIRYVYIDNVEK